MGLLMTGKLTIGEFLLQAVKDAGVKSVLVKQNAWITANRA